MVSETSATVARAGLRHAALLHRAIIKTTCRKLSCEINRSGSSSSTDRANHRSRP
jgi:hypothetical protein